MLKWQYTSFLSYTSGDTAGQQLAKFLNDHSIAEFLVVDESKGFIGLIYREEK